MDKADNNQMNRELCVTKANETSLFAFWKDIARDDMRMTIGEEMGGETSNMKLIDTEV